MTEPVVLTERHGNVLVILMNRPKANAITHAMSRALYAAYEQLQNDPELLVGVLMSNVERIFSAGWDLNEAVSGDWSPEDETDPVRGPGPGGFAGIAENWTLDKPVIAAAHGAIVGGGFEMCLATDIIIVSDDSYFMLPEVKRCLLPDVGGWQRLPRLVPRHVAMELMLTGRRMLPDEAKHWGLVHKIVPRADLKREALALAAEIATGAPLAVRALKAILRETEPLGVKEAMARAKPGRSQVPIYEQLFTSEDFQEGPLAFIEKRPPRWKGK